LSLFIVVSAQEHYLEKHIWEHILKTHIRRVFLWSFFAFLFVDIGLKSFNIEKIINSKLIYVIFISSLVGIIPESGPHLVFVTMFYKGVIPFSVLLVSSLVQDGHALIPLLSHSVKISIWVKIFNLIIGLIIGYTLYCLKL
ncbi:MAG TPA: selenocysteine protein, partial [Candidatus Omnitrophica bacterium]|nr:selenocysteine protein [Candidatus Omnitrophota bacterium]